MLSAMKILLFALATVLFSLAPASAAELKQGPPLPYHLVRDWAKLPKGMNFGEASGVDVDRNGNVWVFNRSEHPIVELDKHGEVIQAWNEHVLRVKGAHGARVDPDGNLWFIDRDGHVVFKTTPAGKILMLLGRQGIKGDNDSKEYFNLPTNVAFAPNGDFFISDGYGNSRVIKFNKDGEYLLHWGKKGVGDGEFNLVHDVALDSRGRVYVADRSNSRVQIFDQNGRFLGKWTDVGQPWGLYYVSKEDALYMCDGLNNRIVKLNTEGQILGTLGSYGKIPGKLDYAHSIAVDQNDGSIYVSEIKNWRVQKWAKNAN
jgi:DNA-binding beta-propeller fold protein YncE